MKLKSISRLRRLALTAVFALGLAWQTPAQPVATNSAATNATNSAATNATNSAATNATVEAAANAASAGKASDRYLTFGLDRIPAFNDYRPFGEPLWKYFASLIYILLAFYASKLLDRIVNVWLKRWAARTETKFDDLLLDLLHGPVKVVMFVILLHIGLNVFKWPAKAEEYLSKGLIIIVAYSITYVALKVVDLALNLWHERHAVEDKLFTTQLLPLIRKSAKTGIIIAAILVCAENIGWEIKSLLAGLSVGGLALGLAAQDTIANIFGAISIILDKPFHIGDRIRVESVEGDVESIGLRSTRVRNLDGHHVSIPNKMMGNVIITNVTRRTNIKTEMNFGLTYDTSADQVKRAVAVLEEIYRAHPKTADLIISFNKFNDSALNICVVHWWDGIDGKAHSAGMQELNLAIKRRFDAEKIEFAFPTQTVYVKQTGS